MEFESDLAENHDRRKMGLVDKARIDSEAFVYLFRLHYDEIFHYCARRLFNRIIAEDVTSTVFLKMVENLPRFNGNLRGFRCWLYRIANNEVNNYFRSAGRLKHLIEAASQKLQAESGRAETADTEKTERLRQAVFSLRPKYQTVVALRFFEGMKLSEVAEILGRKPVTVRSQLSRALKMLRENWCPPATGNPRSR